MQEYVIRNLRFFFSGWQRFSWENARHLKGSLFPFFKHAMMWKKTKILFGRSLFRPVESFIKEHKNTPHNRPNQLGVAGNGLVHFNYAVVFSCMWWFVSPCYAMFFCFLKVIGIGSIGPIQIYLLKSITIYLQSMWRIVSIFFCFYYEH